MSRLDHEAFVRAVYRAALEREPDEAGWNFFTGGLKSGSMSWEEVLGAVLRSEEFRIRYSLGDPCRAGIESLHQARCLLVATHLPPAEAILDLGGSSSHDPEGALFALGYPHTPRELIIVDLPPEVRFGAARLAKEEAVLGAARGTRIRYVHQSMADLSFQPDASVDLVVSGESIEHISEAEADLVCAGAWRVLKPGGRFCLDTPNARLTRLQSPGQLIHPEHQKEYTFSELRAKLRRHGFRIVKALGIVPMPESVKTGQFSWAEMARNTALSEDPEIGYCFFIEAGKPQ
jgi:SAM-dependent methyltransferase